MKQFRVSIVYDIKAEDIHTAIQAALATNEYITHITAREERTEEDED